MAQVRGTSLRGTTDFMRRNFGEADVRRVLDALTPATRRLVGDDGRAPLPSGWYDCAALIELSEHMDRLLGRGDLTLARAAGKALAFEDVNRFFKWLLRLSGPKMLFNRVAGVWRNYHSAGFCVPEEVGDERAVIRVDDWDSAHPVMCKRIEGFMERTLELTLGSGLSPTIRETQHLASDARVGPHAFCRFVAEWRRPT